MMRAVAQVRRKARRIAGSTPACAATAVAVERRSPGEEQEAVWQHFSTDWDKRQGGKASTRQPDLRIHKELNIPAAKPLRAGEVWPGEEAEEELEACRKLLLSDERGGDGAAALEAAVDALERLVQRGCRVPRHLFYRALRRCTEDKSAAAGVGKRIHGLIVQGGYGGDAFLATHLIGLYAAQGRLEDARAAFAAVPTPDAYNWTAIIFAHARGSGEEAATAVRLYRQAMACKPSGGGTGASGGWSSSVSVSVVEGADDRLFLAVLKACAAAKDLAAGKEVHAHIVRRTRRQQVAPDRFVQGALVNMYAKCGSLAEARRVFEELPAGKSVETWNAMMAGYAQQGMGEEAFRLFHRMQQQQQHRGGSGGGGGPTRPTCVTYGCLLQACASMGAEGLSRGKQLHREMMVSQEVLLGESSSVVLGTSLVNMYAKCGSLEDARRVFDGLPQKQKKSSVVAWNALIAGYAQQGEVAEAFRLYRSMQSEEFSPAPDAVTYLCLLQACASVGGAGALEAGKRLHADLEHRGPLLLLPSVGGSLVNMYAKCGSLADARRVFDALPERDVVTWTAMIAGYAQSSEQAGAGREALRLYRAMRQQQQQDAGGGGGGHTTILPDSVTYVCLLQACAGVGVGALEDGKRLHAEIRQRGGEVARCARVGGSLVNMYAKCGSLEAARRLWDAMPEKNVVAWNAMIAGYARQGRGAEALALHANMMMMVSTTSTAQQQQQERCQPDSVTYVCLLQACGSLGAGALDAGKRLHAEISAQGLADADAAVGGALVSMYAKCGDLAAARAAFDALARKDVVTWTAVIAGYAQHGMGSEALHVYASMQHWQQQEEGCAADCVTYACLLQACANMGDCAGALEGGRRVHADIRARGMQDGAVVGGSLVNLYAKCGSVEEARKVFDRLPERNVVVWTVMIAGYARQGMGHEAVRLYRAMMHSQQQPPPDVVTYICLLQACANAGAGALADGQQVHAHMRAAGLDHDPAVGGALVNMYAKCGTVAAARALFDALPHKNVVTWTAMIAAYAQQGMGTEALQVYASMQQQQQEADAVTYVCLLQACAAVGAAALPLGKRLHADMEQLGLLVSSVVAGGSLVNMYAKCGDVDAARRVFDAMPERNVVAWNVMISGYGIHGMGADALRLYGEQQQQQQQRGGCAPDAVTYVCLLQACAAVAALPLGARLHAEIQARSNALLLDDTAVGAALVNMYAKCGSMYHAHRTFDALPAPPSAEAWGALLSGYARQGDAAAALAVLHRMSAAGVRPDGVALLGVLAACSHAGLVEQGLAAFGSMERDHGVRPGAEHYACVVDMLGRAGRLPHALHLARTAPPPPSETPSGGTGGGGVWRALLGACRKWRDVPTAQHAFAAAVALDPRDAAAYVLMANVYASCGMWDAARAVHARRRAAGAWKRPGASWWTDDAGTVHRFTAGDTSHPEAAGIYARLDAMLPAMRKLGYVPGGVGRPAPAAAALVVEDEGDEEEDEEDDEDEDSENWKRAARWVCRHSERLAIAYALMKTAAGTTVRVVKNLRVCEDCHAATGVMARLEKRTIVCRDATRFHVFTTDGKCSCRDYW